MYDSPKPCNISILHSCSHDYCMYPSVWPLFVANIAYFTACQKMLVFSRVKANTILKLE